jgi:hypothetical protein
VVLVPPFGPIYTILEGLTTTRRGKDPKREGSKGQVLFSTPLSREIIRSNKNQISSTEAFGHCYSTTCICCCGHLPYFCFSYLFPLLGGIQLKTKSRMNEGTFGYEDVKSCSNGSSRWLPHHRRSECQIDVLSIRP